MSINKSMHPPGQTGATCYIVATRNDSPLWHHRHRHIGTGLELHPAGWPCTRSDALAPGGRYPPITLTVNIASNAAPNVTNIATVAGGRNQHLQRHRLRSHRNFYRWSHARSHRNLHLEPVRNQLGLRRLRPCAHYPGSETPVGSI